MRPVGLSMKIQGQALSYVLSVVCFRPCAPEKSMQTSLEFGV